MRFYLDLWEDGQFSEDPEGIDVPSEDAAFAAAKEAACEIAADLVPRGMADQVIIRLRDQDARAIATFTVSMTVADRRK